MRIIKKNIKDVLGSIYYNFYKKNRINYGNRCLIYHAFGSKLEHDSYGISISMKNFKEHIKYITDNYEICKINEIPTNRFCISLSIDDGYKCTLDAISLLCNYDIHVTLFITVDTLNKDQYLNNQDLISISSLKNVSICSHGFTHNRLSEMQYNDQLKEINDSKTILEKITKNNIPGISFAHGSFNNDTMNILKKSSYDFAATSIKGINTNDMQKFLLRRNEIVSNDKICDLDKKIKGYYDYY